MPANLATLPTRTADGHVRVVVESPRGSQVKLKYDPRLGIFEVSRPLVLGFRYPYDWGFIPSTRAPDGDPLDALVLWDVPSFPGTVIPCRPIAVVQVVQDEKQGKKRVHNDRVIAVPVVSARGEELTDLDDLPERVREEIAHFFESVVAFAGKNARVIAWADAADAEKLVDKLRRRR